MAIIQGEQQTIDSDLGKELGGGGGGERIGGPRLPGPPEGDDLNEFLQYVHSLLTEWNERIRAKDIQFDHVDGDDRQQLKAGWADFQNQWEASLEQLEGAVRELDKEDMGRRGLRGSAYRMKLHFVRKAHRNLQTAYAQLLDRFTIRKLWHKLFTTADVILDSASTALAPIPGAGAIVSGLKEFKETAMGVSEVVD